MSAHAVLAPSAAHRWLACPGSAEACAGYHNTETVFSREGTFAHSIAAELLSDRAQMPYAVTKIGATDGEFTLDAEMAAHLQTYLDAVRTVLVLSDKVTLFEVEQGVKVTEDIWGTADCLIVADGKLHVFDLKYGAGVFVPADGNEQLMVYAIGALARAPKGKRAVVREVVLHIVQPRCPAEEVHRHWSINRDDLRTFEKRLKAAAEAALAPGAIRVPGDHCRWCDARGDCHALRDQAMAVARVSFDPAAAKADPVVPETLTPEQLARALALANTVELWLKAVRDRAHQLAMSGTTIPGYKLVEKIGNRRWADETAAEQALRGLGVDPHEHKLISPAQAEKAAGKAAAKTLEHLIVRPVTGVALVTEADKRPAITGDATSVFSAIPDGDS